MPDNEPPSRDLPHFRSNRLLFRPFAPSDAEDAFSIFRDTEVMRYSVSGRDRDLEETAARVERYARQNAASGLAPWAVVETASECVVGSCGLTRLKDGKDVEIAYRLRRDRWGRGFAIEAAMAWLDRGFSLLRLPRILAFVDPANTASLRVVDKIGMRFVENCRYEGIPVRKYEIANENTVASGDASELERDRDEQV
jgi:[ribosomal protein S5]-alanine N-acetyltransferase